MKGKREADNNFNFKSEKLDELRFEEIIVSVRAVVSGIAVPRGKVESKSDAAAPAGVRKSAHDIALAVLIGGIFDGMLGGFCLP